MSCHNKTFHMNIFVVLSTCYRISPCPTFQLIHLNRIIYEESNGKNSLHTAHQSHVLLHMSCLVSHRKYQDLQHSSSDQGPAVLSKVKDDHNELSKALA